MNTEHRSRTLRFCGWVLLLVTLLALLGELAVAATEPNVADVRCKISDGAGGDFAGSATVIHGDKGGCWVLTAYHVIRDGVGRPRIIAMDGSEHPAIAVNTDAESDLAILRSTYASEAWRDLAVGTEGNVFWITGWPRSQREFRVHQTRMQTKYMHGQVGYVGEAISGQSGGAILDSSGRLIGVVSAAGEGETVGPTGDIVLRFVKETVTRFGYSADCESGTCKIQRQPQAPQPRPQAKPRLSCQCEAQFKSIESRLSVLENTKPVAGADGLDGRDGKDGVVDQGQLAIAVSNAIDIDSIVQRVVREVEVKAEPRAKPFYIRVNNSSPYQPVMPGQYVTLPLSRK